MKKILIFIFFISLFKANHVYSKCDSLSFTKDLKVLLDYGVNNITSDVVYNDRLYYHNFLVFVKINENFLNKYKSCNNSFYYKCLSYIYYQTYNNFFVKFRFEKQNKVFVVQNNKGAITENFILQCEYLFSNPETTFKYYKDVKIGLFNSADVIYMDEMKKYDDYLIIDFKVMFGYQYNSFEYVLAGMNERRLEMANEKILKMLYIIGVISTFLFALIIVQFLFFKKLKKQKKIIELKEKETQQQKHIIEEKHKEISDSINYAERIQRSFLATIDFLNSKLKNYFIFFKPKDVVSGDFYWAETLLNGNLAIATADSTGHGVPGAIMSLLNITALEKAIEKNTNPSDILNATRKIIIDRLKRDGSTDGGKDGMDCCLCVFDFKNMKLLVSSAHNPLWIVRNSNNKIDLIEVKPDKMPVGKHDKQDIPFVLHEIDLQTGDIVYTLTDGFPDQFGGENGKKFMIKNLRELLLSNSHLSMNQQREMLEKTFMNWKLQLEQVDDVTVIGIKV